MEKAKSNLFGIFIALLFVCFALALYTFYNAKGFSYFSDDSNACNNCHVMNEVYGDYIKGSHSKKVAGVAKATCNDCHVPHSSFMGKWVAKAQSGVGHAYAFTFKLNELPSNLSANEKTKHWVQDNCVRCHTDMAANAINATTNPHQDSTLSCVSCHPGVGHRRGF